MTDIVRVLVDLGWSPSALLGVLQPLAILAGGIWVLITFRNNNRIKSIETLITLEVEYKKHIPILLEIECDYTTKIKPLLDQEARGELSNENRQKLNKLDEVLRHFVICAHIRNLGVDRGLLDETYRYYLQMLYADTHPELKAYISRYWGHVQHWAEVVEIPSPKCWTRWLR